MKNKIAAIVASLIVAAGMTGCALFQSAISKAKADYIKANAFLADPANQANIKGTAQAIVTVAAFLEPFASNKTLANSLDAARVVGNAYSNQVPSSVLQATTESLAVTKAVAPIVSNGANLTTMNKVIDEATALLNKLPSATPTP